MTWLAQIVVQHADLVTVLGLLVAEQAWMVRAVWRLDRQLAILTGHCASRSACPPGKGLDL